MRAGDSRAVDSTRWKDTRACLSSLGSLRGRGCWLAAAFLLDGVKVRAPGDLAGTHPSLSCL